MCREKGAVRHDDRIDALAQGIKYYTDILSISAQEQINSRKREEWNDLINNWEDDRDCFASHLVFNLSMDQRRQSRNNDNSVPNWV